MLAPEFEWPESEERSSALHSVPEIRDLSQMTDTPGYQRFFAELKRRRVLRVMAAYGVVAFGIIEAADVILPRMALPDWTVTFVVWLALLGLPIVIVLAWALEMTPEGVQRTVEAAPGELEEIIPARPPSDGPLACSHSLAWPRCSGARGTRADSRLPRRKQIRPLAPCRNRSRCCRS